ncbi:iron ABC transporter permease [Fervidobacterium riparium]|nr:iron ABC transporter permease [Fervidobacterium riparium]
MSYLRRRTLLFSINITLLLLTFFVSLNTGAVKVAPAEILKSLFSESTGTSGIVRDIRLPRLLIAIIAGMNLSISGVMLQAVMQNPLVEPGITGISAGAALVTIIFFLYFPQNYYYSPILSFFGGILAAVVVYFMAWKKGLTPVRIVLSGVIVNSLLGSMISLISILNSEKVGSILSWLNGSLAGRGWSQAKSLAIYSLFGYVMSVLVLKACNVILLGDKNVQNVGYNVNLLRVVISAVGIYLAAVSTSIIGIVGFLGLVVPHISRFIVGSNYYVLVPYSAISGALLLLVADTLARTLFAPTELPVGIIMSLIGAPFFLFLLRKRS